MKKIKAKGILSLGLALFLLLSSFGGVVTAAPDPSDDETLSDGPGDTGDLESLLSPAQQKLGGDLLQLLNPDLVPPGRSQGDLRKDMKKLHQLSGSSARKSLSTSSSDQVYVYIKFNEGYNMEDVKASIDQVVSQDKHNSLLAAWVDIDQLEALASADEVNTIKTVIPPVAKSGSVNSQGDVVHRADLVRALGVDGSGIKVGIISDGANHWASARDSGDLPEDVTILEDDIPWGGEEGTALMEIVYDLAPGAKLYFHDCGTNILEFNLAIDDLIDAGCNIICDDITWVDEPFFEDGIIANHVKDVIADDQIVYVSSAGNYGLSHYQGTFRRTRKDDLFWHNFAQGHSNQKNIKIQIPAGGIAYVVLEWNEPFGSSRCNYDLYLLDPNTGEALLASESIQNGDQDPLEFIGVGNDSTESAEVLIAVKASNRAALLKPRVLETYIYGAEVDTKKVVAPDSIFGHPAVPGVIACGAVAADSFDEIEEFSSQGPVTMLSGHRLKPDLCGVDGVDVTGAGGFYTPLYGTSASAPHVAAIAALVWSKAPALDAADIRDKLLKSAVDLGRRGKDNIYGYGRADALKAVATELSIHSLDPDKSSPQEKGETIRWTCIAEGEGQLSYSWQIFKGSKAVIRTPFSDDNNFDWTPTEKGKYRLKVLVKDESGQTSTRVFERYIIR